MNLHKNEQYFKHMSACLKFIGITYFALLPQFIKKPLAKRPQARLNGILTYTN